MELNFIIFKLRGLDRIISMRHELIMFMMAGCCGIIIQINLKINLNTIWCKEMSLLNAMSWSIIKITRFAEKI